MHLVIGSFHLNQECVSGILDVNAPCHRIVSRAVQKAEEGWVLLEAPEHCYC